MRTLLDYVIEGELGRGAQAVVHRARRLPGDQIVALKRPITVDEAGRDRLRHEARVLSRCVHPHVVPLLDVVAPGVDDPPHALALGLAPGGSLLDRLRRDGQQPVEEVAALAGQMAVALEAIHAGGYAHGDVKPANILLGSDGLWWLADLDSAALLGCEQSRAEHTLTGTMPYLAPEAMEGHPPDPLCDLHALAVTCLEVLAPEGATNDSDLVRLLEAAAEDDRSKRPASISAFAERLAEIGPAGPCPERPVASSHPISWTGPDDAPTHEFGPRPVRSAIPSRPPVASSSGWARRAVIAVSALGLSATVTGLVFTDPDDGSSAHTETRHSPPSADAISPPADHGEAGRQPSAPCPGSMVDPTPSGPTDGDTATQVQLGDVDGEGCTRPVRWTTGSAEVVVERSDGSRHFRLGRPGDELLIGDWDGDTHDEPGLYRPATGEVFRFASWATKGEPLVSAPVELTGIAAGRARVVRTAGRDRVIVDPPGNGS